MKRSPNRLIAVWLLSGCLLIASMVVIGGITRLTGSGLSIVEWGLITGTLPPLSQKSWEETFEKYKASPQFKKVNYDFTLNEFKSIFWWEYIHRLLGRLIGMVFIIPYFYFLLRKAISKSLNKKLLFIFLLGGLQGFIGWYMVKSGIVDNPRVSHYRLASHLITAFITYSFTFRVALGLLYPADKTDSKQMLSLRNLTKVTIGVLFIQLVYGAFVAGLKAGMVYNTFPKMGNDWIPEAVFVMKPLWVNFFENIAGVQFIHRYAAWILVFLVLGLWIYSRKFALNTVQKSSLKITGTIVLIQFTLGVLTLLYGVPLLLGIIHQIGALALLTSLLFFYHQLKEKRIKV